MVTHSMLVITEW